MKTTTEAQLQIEREASDQDLEHAGCLSIAQAAASLHLHRESLRQMLKRHDLGHTDPSWSGLSPKLHVTIDELATAYPALVTFRHAKPRRRHALTVEQLAETHGPDNIAPHTPEFEAAKLRNHRRTSE